MKLIDQPITKKTLASLKHRFGDYVKVTVDITKKILVVGCQLHADGEKILLESGSLQDNIWGGGINLQTLTIDATAILNLRPKLNNNSLEILDSDRRQKFIAAVQYLFNL